MPAIQTAMPARAQALPLPMSSRGSWESPRQQVSDLLNLLNDAVPVQRTVVRAGDVIYKAGDAFGKLYVLNSGSIKIVNLSSDGREQIAGFKFRGDWCGLDGIARGHYTCDAVALDTGEVWVFRYDALLAAASAQPALLTVMHRAMSSEIAHERDSMMSLCTLPSDARVADFLRYWAESLARHGLRTDQITLRMTRAEIGNYLGMTLETVSRALSKLAREGLIGFNDKGRKEVAIPDVGDLADYVQRALVPADMLQ